MISRNDVEENPGSFPQRRGESHAGNLAGALECGQLAGDILAQIEKLRIDGGGLPRKLRALLVSANFWSRGMTYSPVNNYSAVQ